MRLHWFSGLILAAAVSAAVPQGAAVKPALSRMPLAFETNKGQWGSAVRYGGRAGEYSVLLTASGPAIAFGDHRVDIALPGSNPASVMEPLDPMAVRTSYMVGPRENWRFNIASYSRVRYRDVYPGIDAVYYGTNGQLEYDFVLHPGANPDSIRMRFEGADHVDITARGDLAIETGKGTLTQQRPVIYQESKDGRVRPVSGRYTMLASGLVGLQLDHYDRSLPLVIDPVLTLTTYIGGKAEDQITGIKVDANGKLYIVGRTFTGDLAATETAYSSAPKASGVANIFIAVANTTAAGGFSIQYLTYLGGTGGDTPTGMDVDSAGNVYIAGNTLSTDFPIVGSAFLTTAPSTTGSVFVAKLNPALSSTDALIYSSYLGGSGINKANGMAVDRSGNIYVIGTTTSSDFPVTDGAYAGVLWGYSDAFMTKIDPNSSALAYSTYLGGEDQDEGRAIAVAPSGLAYFAVTTFSTQFPLAFSAFHTTLAGDSDSVVGIMDMTKSGINSLVTSTYFGGSGHDEVRKLALDAQGRVLLTGFTFSSDLPVTPDAVVTSYAGKSDAFAAVLDPSRSDAFLVYSTYLNGTDGEVGYDIAADASGYVYVTGYTLSFDFPVSPDATQPTYNGGTEVFVCKLKPGQFGRDGLVFSTYVGGEGLHIPASLTVGSDGTVYVAGYSNAGLTTIGSDARSFQGGYSDGFIMTFGQLAGQALRSDRRSTTRAPRY